MEPDVVVDLFHQSEIAERDSWPVPGPSPSNRIACGPGRSVYTALLMEVMLSINSCVEAIEGGEK